ncbi:MAG TPA: hypothetical protein VGH98_08085 [Gemmatimonadaceae bacterium]
MPSKSGSRILLALFAAAAVGCSDNATGPTSPNVPDVAELLAEMSSPTLSSAAGIGSRAIAPAFNSSSVDPANCQYSATTGFFECSTVTINGLTFTRSFRLIDDAGNSQPTPDTHTSAIETKTTVDGTVSSSGSNYTLHGNTDETLSGIRTNTHTLNGTSLLTDDGTIQVGTTVVPVDETVHETTSNLVLPNAKAGQRWPQSGTITIQTGLGSDGLDGTSTMVVTFNGTSVVTITTTTSFGTITCRVDLANPSAGLGACI